MPIRLLVVEDHRLVREGLIRLLGEHPAIEVSAAAANGAEALACLESSCVDVVLLDIGLPDIDGMRLLPEIRERCPEAKTLVLTMHAAAEYSNAAIERGASGVLVKSAPLERVIDAIRKVHHGEVLRRGSVLSDREQEVLGHVAEGISNQEIALAMGLQAKTVEGYCQRLMDKLAIHTRAGLMAYARRARSVRR